MNISKKLMMLLAALALSFGTTACGDDASEDSNNGGENGENGENGGGNGENQNNCTEEGAFTCQGDVLFQCTANTWQLVDMCDPGACDADAKGCKDTATPVCDPENFQQECVNQRQYKTCSEDGMKFEFESCGDRMRCNQKTNACEEDPCADCASQGKVCYNDQCVDTIEKGIVGTACTCKSNCQITIKGKEIKDSVNIAIPSDYKAIVEGAAGVLKIDVNAVLAEIKRIFNTIKDEEEIVAPNYFSQDITGCEGLVAPDGMAVGCFFSETITFPKSITDVLDVQLPEFLTSAIFLDAQNKLKEAVEKPLIQLMLKAFIEDVDLNTILNYLDADFIMEKVQPVSALLKDGIQFKANKGYCMTADIEIKADLSNMMTEIIPGVFSSDGKSGLTSKINTVNLGTSHDKAKVADCPKGSTLLSYTIDKSVNLVGTFNVGFDMCAQACITSADCRTEDGYKCVRIPNAAPLNKDDVPPTSQVCLNADMITYFCDMTNMFPSEDGTTAATCSLSDFVVE